MEQKYIIGYVFFQDLDNNSSKDIRLSKEYGKMYKNKRKSAKTLFWVNIHSIGHLPTCFTLSDKK